MSPPPNGPMPCAVSQTAITATASSAVAAARLPKRSAAQKSGGNTAYGSGSTAIIGVEMPPNTNSATASVVNAIAASSTRRGAASGASRASHVQIAGATTRMPTAFAETGHPHGRRAVRPRSPRPAARASASRTRAPAAGPANAPKTRKTSTSRRCASDRSKRATLSSSHQPSRHSPVTSAAEKNVAPAPTPAENPTASAPTTTPGTTRGPQATSAASAIPVEGHMTAKPPANGKSAAAAMPTSQ